jgi:hypothetical protein
MAAPEVLSFREFRAGLAGVARAVAALSASRLTGLERRRLPGLDDLARPQAFHRYILGYVYGRAGQLRTASIDSLGSVSCLPQHLVSCAADVSGRLAAADRLRGLARDPFLTALAGSSPTSTRCTRSARATAAPSGRSSPSSPATPGITSPGAHGPRPQHGRQRRRPPRRPGPAPGNARPADRPAAPLQATGPGGRARNRTSRQTRPPARRPRPAAVSRRGLSRGPRRWAVEGLAFAGPGAQEATPTTGPRYRSRCSSPAVRPVSLKMLRSVPGRMSRPA